MTVNLPQIILVGHPNVGKSQLFNCLTGRQVVVSNYPGTTVELARGRGKIAGRDVEVVDSPGLYSLSAISPEEQVTRLLLLRRKPELVIQVVDARNLRRMLSLTLELLEAGLPLIIALNMIDEAKSANLRINWELLSRRLGVAVIPTALVTQSGLKQLCRTAAAAIWGCSKSSVSCPLPVYPSVLAVGLSKVEARLTGDYGLSRRTVAFSLLYPDPAFEAEVKKREGPRLTLPPEFNSLRRGRDTLLLLTRARRQCSEALLKGIIVHPAREPFSLSERLSRFLLNPVGGSITLAIVLYFGFYRFVGGFGAGTLVELLEERLFMGVLAPYLDHWAELYLPWVWQRELLVLDYGILTLGLRYTFTIILPIMTVFFLFFSVIEDSGYLPRAAYLINFVMEKIGLNGKSVIPLTLGFGCGTLAVLVTRTLETRRERLQASLILCLAIPCSAQLGLILALLAQGRGLVIWLLMVLISFFIAAMAGRLFFGSETAPFCLEIPPLRMPRPGAVLRKTAARLRWYLREVLPLFVGLSVLIWVLQKAGLMGLIISAIRPVAATMGLPEETALVFVYGFLRRDYGAAGLFDLARADILNGGQVLVAAVALTLFLPCIAQLAILFREHGPGFALFVIAATGLTAWLAGMAVYFLTGIPFIAGLI